MGQRVGVHRWWTLGHFKNWAETVPAKNHRTSNINDIITQIRTTMAAAVAPLWPPSNIPPANETAKIDLFSHLLSVYVSGEFSLLLDLARWPPTLLPWFDTVCHQSMTAIWSREEGVRGLKWQRIWSAMMIIEKYTIIYRWDIYGWCSEASGESETIVEKMDATILVPHQNVESMWCGRVAWFEIWYQIVLPGLWKDLYAIESGWYWGISWVH